MAPVSSRIASTEAHDPTSTALSPATNRATPPASTPNRPATSRATRSKTASGGRASATASATRPSAACSRASVARQGLAAAQLVLGGATGGHVLDRADERRAVGRRRRQAGEADDHVPARPVGADVRAVDLAGHAGAEGGGQAVPYRPASSAGQNGYGGRAPTRASRAKPVSSAMRSLTPRIRPSRAQHQQSVLERLDQRVQQVAVPAHPTPLPPPTGGVSVSRAPT